MKRTVVVLIVIFFMLSLTAAAENLMAIKAKKVVTV